MKLFTDIKLDRASATPLYIQLYNTIKGMISEGILVPDFKLPSVRNLSSTLGVNTVTVVSCYRSLEADGFIYTKTGSGTFVANILPLIDSESPTDRNLILDELYQGDDLTLLNNAQININEDTVNFASATPSSDLFPVEDFKLVLNEVLERDRGNAFNYQDSQGFYPLRSSICSFLCSNMVNCNEQSIQIISGAQQGIDIIAKALLRQDDYVITESPTYTGAIAVFKSRGAQFAGVDMDKDGMNLDLLEYNLKKFKPKLIYTIPSFQNPTGISYSDGKRKALLNLAERYNAYIIEDDYVSELDFDGRKNSPVKSMDKYDRVIFIKSFSKLFMPGLRFGYMIVPKKLKEYVIEAKHATDISTSGLIQRAFDLYIRKGMWDKHFNFMYDIYKQRYIKTVNTLDRNLPASVTYQKPGGGLNIWLNLPYSYMANSLFKLACSNNIVFAPGRIFYSSSPTNLNNIRLSFAAVTHQEIEEGISKLCELISNIQKGVQSTTVIPIL